MTLNIMKYFQRPSSDVSPKFQNANVLITGGMGFIGSNLAIALCQRGAKVTIADDMNPEYGGNPFNIESVRDRVQVNFSDICDPGAMNNLVQGKNYIFHLAGQVCHVKSLSDPFPDIDINVKGTAVLMEACKRYNPEAIVIYTGTRGQYGPTTKFPVAETMPSRPKGIYEISNLAAEQIVKVYHEVHHIRSVMLRLTNIYGPRAQMKHDRFGVANWFMRLAIEGNAIPIFGTGSLKRDFLYVDDCVAAILQAAASPRSYGEIFNVGYTSPSSFLELANTIIKVLGRGSCAFVPFSPERKAQEPGDFYSDIRKIKKYTGWTPKTTLPQGVRMTLDYYLKYREKYW